MLLQIWAEMKKILKNKWIWLIFMAVILISSVFSQSSSNLREYQGLSDEGEMLNGKEAYWYTEEIGKEYEGAMDDAWFARFEQDYMEAKKKYLAANFDVSRMQEVYGNDWMDYYIANEKDFMNEKHIKENPEYLEQGRMPYYEIEQAPGYTLRYSFLSSLRYNYVEYVQTKPWNQNGIVKKGSEDFSLYSNTLLQNQEKDFIKDTLNKEEIFYYGNSDGWKALLSLIANSYFLFPMFLILISSNMFNKEKNTQMMEIIRTSKYGKKKCAIAKIIAITLTAWLFTALLLAADTLYIFTTMGLGNWQVNAAAAYVSISPFTFQQIYLSTIALYMLGAFVIVQTCCLLSCLLKSNYVSLLLSTAVIVIPNVLPGKIFHLFPLQFMELGSCLINGATFQFLDSIYFIKDIAFIWILPIIVFALIGYYYYKSYRFLKE